MNIWKEYNFSYWDRFFWRKDRFFSRKETVPMGNFSQKGNGPNAKKERQIMLENLKKK